MSAYMFFNVTEFTDDKKMEEYRQHVFSIVEKFGGRYLIIGGEQTAIEGEKELAFPVLIEFESSEQAMDWYNSEEYQEIINLRLDSTEGNLVLIDGFGACLGFHKLYSGYEGAKIMKVLVIGGTGTVGSQVVHELLNRDVEVKVLTRNAENAEKLPRNVTAVIGDLQEPETVRRIFSDVDGVFLLNFAGPTETFEGLMAVNGARMAGVKRIVYLSVEYLEEASHLPHFGSKIPIELAIKESGIPFTILRPNNFFQNDYWFKQSILEHGIYPQPYGDLGVTRVDVRDIAEAAAIALTTDGEHIGETYNLAGIEAQTGESTAETWSRALGKKVVYGGNDLDEWERQTLKYLPAWMTFDFKLMYEYVQKEGFLATAEDIERQTKLIGHTPRSFEDFANETAAIWLSDEEIQSSAVI